MVFPGLQNWSPVAEGNSEQGLGTGAQVDGKSAASLLARE